jgi:serine/threonine-protein kinase
VGPPSDVWGLAATLHHAIAREVPFPRERDAGDSKQLDVRFPQLVGEPRPLPDDTPAPMRDLIAQSLARRPGDRPSAAGVARGLEAMVSELPRKLVFGRRGARAR